MNLESAFKSLLIIGVALACISLYLISQQAFAHDADEASTNIECRGAGAPYGPYTMYKPQTLDDSQGDVRSHHTPIYDDNSAYRWCRYVSGDNACLFTAILETRQVHDRGQLVANSVGGGRDCNAKSGPNNDGQCGYFLPGYQIYGVSGHACAGLSIQPCNGICN